MKVDPDEMDPTKLTTTSENMLDFVNNFEMKQPLANIEDDIFDQNGHTLIDSEMDTSNDNIEVQQSNQDNKAPGASDAPVTSDASVTSCAPGASGAPGTSNASKGLNSWKIHVEEILEGQNDESNSEDLSEKDEKTRHEAIPSSILKSGDPCVAPFRADDDYITVAIDFHKKNRSVSIVDSGIESDPQNPYDADISEDTDAEVEAKRQALINDYSSGKATMEAADIVNGKLYVVYGPAESPEQPGQPDQLDAATLPPGVPSTSGASQHVRTT